MLENSESVIIIGMIAVGFGVANCFWGYKIFRITLSLVAIFAGLALGVLIFPEDKTAAIITGTIIGLVGATIINVLYSFSILLGGGLFGGTVAVAAISGFGQELDVPIAITVVIIGVILGVLLARVVQRMIVILSTAFAGAAGIAGGVALLLYKELPEETTKSLVLLAAWIALGVVGVVVQNRSKGSAEKL